MELGRDKTVSLIISRLQAAAPGKGAVKVEGTWGSFARLLTARISNKLDRPILHICPHIDDADNAAEDLRTFGVKHVLPLPAWEGEEAAADATDEIRAERLRVAMRLVSGDKNFLLTTSIQALCQPAVKREALEQDRLELRVDKTLPPAQVVEWLLDNGFERVDTVDLPGQFARRGGIVDIYAPLLVEKITRNQSNVGATQQATEPIRI